ncbi:transcriptional regulator [Rhodopseudomonas palustris]|uniref:Transcriptional regulator n=1 Tax=Rhodopseudomonas palustris TaxID=1076 RepID=A0A323UN17_RHOPL|nr:nucleotidyltransferase domain-containing protein [Rhodopseudomonas palustris]PZA14025.1 transcriptional regulator [Rhodopseudomonas palustris]
MNELSPSEALFSAVQQRVLGLLFGQPSRSFYTSEIVRRVRSGTGAVERELSRLRRSGLVSVQHIGNQKHYQADPDSPIFNELCSLVKKTVGIADPVRDALEPFSDAVATAFIFGSVAKGTETANSDVDLMVIGDDLDYSELYSAAQTMEHALGRKVNPIFLTPRDWGRKASDATSFVSKVAIQPKIFVRGSEKNLHAWTKQNSITSSASATSKPNRLPAPNLTEC